MNVQELMSRPAAICREKDSLNSAAGQMWDRDCGALPVVNDNETVIGMITDRDICMAAYTEGKRLADICVGEITNRNVFAVGPNDTIQHAEKVMCEHQVRRVPVIDEEDNIVGMLSLNDIAREGAREKSRTNKNVGSDEVLHTLATIGQPNGTSATAGGAGSLRVTV